MQFCHREPPDVMLALPQTVSQIKFFPPQAADCQVVNHSNIKHTSSEKRYQEWGRGFAKPLHVLRPLVLICGRNKQEFEAEGNPGVL